MLKLIRTVQLKAERSCETCSGVITVKEECVQELHYSEGGPYLAHKHQGCTDWKEGD